MKTIYLVYCEYISQSQYGDSADNTPVAAYEDRTTAVKEAKKINGYIQEIVLRKQ